MRASAYCTVPYVCFPRYTAERWSARSPSSAPTTTLAIGRSVLRAIIPASPPCDRRPRRAPRPSPTNTARPPSRARRRPRRDVPLLVRRDLAQADGAAPRAGVPPRRVLRDVDAVGHDARGPVDLPRDEGRDGDRLDRVGDRALFQEVADVLAHAMRAGPVARVRRVDEAARTQRAEDCRDARRVQVEDV